MNQKIQKYIKASTKIITGATIILTLLTLYAYSQPIAMEPIGDTTALKQTKKMDILQILPMITFLFALITGVLNLYIMNKLYKTEEKIMSTFRIELKSEVLDLEKKMVTKEQLANMKELMGVQLENLGLKINLGNHNIISELKAHNSPVEHMVHHKAD